MMDKYLEAEKRLAELQGITDLELVRGSEIDMCCAGSMLWKGKRGGLGVIFAPYARDWAACGPLMVEHGCWPRETFIGEVSVPWGIDLESVDEAFIDHPDKDMAARYAIVLAVIAKLERQ
jgi:hypothetical protein